MKKDREARALVYRERGGAVNHDGTISSGHFVQFDGHQFRPSVQAYATFKIVDYSPCPGCDRISTSEAIEPKFAHVAEWLRYHALIDTTFVMTLNTSWLFFKMRRERARTEWIYLPNRNNQAVYQLVSAGTQHVDQSRQGGILGTP